MSNRQQLSNSIRVLFEQAGWYDHGPRPPSASVVLGLAPHLSEREALALIASDEAKTTFIGPPLKVRGAEHVYVIDRSNPQQVKLRHKFCYRRKESYINDDFPCPDDWKKREFDYRERVANYAELTWGDELVWDRSAMSAVFHLADPTVVSAGGHLVTGSGVLAWLNNTIENINGQGDLRPAVELLDRAILECSKDLPVMMEMVGDRLPFAAFNCNRCGGGLLADRCNFCNAPVVAQTGGRVETRIPLPITIINEVGGVFITPPIQAIKHSYMEWASKDYHPPLSMPGQGRERIVDLRDTNEM